MKNSPGKLVLFDIDGTLVHSSASGVAAWMKRIKVLFDEVYNSPLTFDIKTKEFNGMIDVQTWWAIAQRQGISRTHFLEKLSEAKTVYYREMHGAITRQEIVYESIKEASVLVKKLALFPHISVGLITGNLPTTAKLKLETAGITYDFPMGLYGDQADSRVELASLAYDVSQKVLGKKFSPKNIVFIGDTLFDVEAGIRAGGQTIAVATGYHHSREELLAYGPTLAVHSLMDPAVLDFFKIET